MPSFDVVSKLDLAEVDNALAGIAREIATRFDFKGSNCSVKREEGALTVLADDDLKLKQMHELLKAHLTRRKVDAAALEFKPPEKASGHAVHLNPTAFAPSNSPPLPAAYNAFPPKASAPYLLNGGSFDGFLKKPFHVRQVIESIEDAMAVVY